MARESAVARAAKAKADLDESARAQAEIAKQAIKAIDNGADPELVASLAMQAANAVSNPVVEEAPVTPYVEPLRHDFTGQSMKHIRIVDWSHEASATTWMFDMPNGVGFCINIDANGKSEVPESVAEYLVTHRSGFAFCE
jgi:hypothetical protein